MPRPSATGSSAELATFDPRAPREFWLDGESVMCACPDCGAPISIRLWLMVADCWQCGCSIEISAAQERRIQSMLRNDAKPRQQNGLPLHQRRPALPGNRRQTAPPPARQPASQPQGPAAPTRKSQASGPAHSPRYLHHSRRSVKDWLNQMPAWLISMLLHMALLALLALLFFDGGSEEDPFITLSTEANRQRRSGGDVTFESIDDPFRYDLPIPKEQVPKTPRQHEAMARANQDAKALRVDPGASLPQLPTLQQVKQRLQSSTPSQRTLAARDPRFRAEIVTKEGGTTLSEAAVARGLRWLSQHQGEAGNWNLQCSRRSPCRGRCRNDGNIRSDSAATSLALLPFLGAGQTHQVGIYQDTVAKGLRWLLQMQAEDGDLRGRSQENAGMYAHGQGAIVLCEAFALTGDEQLRDAAQRAIDFIVEAQHAEGGWRYEPGQPGDTSVLGWQLMALQSARAAQLDVPLEVLELAGIYLDSVQFDDGSRYSYQPSHRPTHVMTAEALLCRMYLGWTKEFAGLDQGVKYLVRRHPPSQRSSNLYYWYYATQVLHHYGGKEWKKWNVAMRDILVASQEKRGHEAGSWDPPRDNHSRQAGRLYATALAVCTLEVYYRHAPIFRQLELD